MTERASRFRPNSVLPWTNSAATGQLSSRNDTAPWRRFASLRRIGANAKMT